MLCALCARCAHRIPKPRPSSRQRYPAEYSCKISQLYKAGNMVTVLAKLSVHSTCAIVREQILKPRPSSHRPCPTECSCQFSQLYKAGNTVTVLAKLAAHALNARAIARDAHTGPQNQDPPVINDAPLNIHAKFHSCIKQETW